MTTGERIRTARKNANMTQAELAQKLGISYVGVSQWENGLRQPKYETLKKIADAIGVEWYTLVPPEESSRIILKHTSDVIAQADNQEKTFVRTWPPEPSFPSAEDKHLAGLTDLYYQGVLHWAEDKLFSETETITIKMHFSELLLKYKQLIERTLYAKLSLAEIEEPGMPQTLIQQRLADDLEKELNNLKAWIDTIPLYFSATVSYSSNQSENSSPSEDQ
ncbi:MAG: helix-turn-helix transcriptional regulator [Lachnospiraceae bacterium]|nr:helix-turn-helix transcriptional regulator [Lachnospiraceae bacterium]